MKLSDSFVHTGSIFFRLRSYLPLLFIPLFVASFRGATYLLNSHTLDLVWEMGCLLISMMGLAVRMFTVGTSPRGTSGRNTRAQRADVLNTTGPYSVVRHPLYLGNYLIALGLSFFPRTWFLPIIVASAALLYYERIAAYEEEYLETKFGGEFRRWAARVPAVVPCFRNYEPPATPFSWEKALRQEFYGVFVIAGGFFALEVIQDFAVNGRIMFDPVWTGIFVVGTSFFVVMWTLKKLGLLRGRRDRVLGPGPCIDPRR